MQYVEITRWTSQESRTVKLVLNEWDRVDAFPLKHELHTFEKPAVKPIQFIANSKSISFRYAVERRAEFKIYALVNIIEDTWRNLGKTKVNIWFCGVIKKKKLHVPSLSVDGSQRHWSVFCAWCEIFLPVSISTLPLPMQSAAPGDVSGPIMRNTRWLTQIENTTRWESDCSCSWSTHVTSFSNHRSLTERNPLLQHHAGKDSGFKHFVSSIGAILSEC